MPEAVGTMCRKCLVLWYGETTGRVSYLQHAEHTLPKIYSPRSDLLPLLVSASRNRVQTPRCLPANASLRASITVEPVHAGFLISFF
jgi:hypothetical protein